MTTAAICATRELSWTSSFYRGEQYDPDLGLYYLRARYYNPATGRFLSRDPEDGNITDPATLHKYLYANGDPVNMVDPRGRGAYEDGLLIGKIIGRAVVQVAFVGCLVDTMYAGIAEVLKAVAEHHPGVPKLPMPPLPFHLPCVVLGVYWGILWASGLFFGTAG
jgi:RHS repeat-associated protein